MTYCASVQEDKYHAPTQPPTLRCIAAMAVLDDASADVHRRVVSLRALLGPPASSRLV
jgi:hypothetical protein